ncbi:PREDICTED: uncharacterized protein LOC107188681 [Dufourea novaeangliae]|uniref:uncharacterized protein LOC107188681 n=1 Tax=Dufourea novaeangliae TaxID=178035 RepID=UPI0007676DB5|nr:PREDICTED: uncharacterized protein LOC107188681 [Dufourea novaeangliae]
MSTESVYNDIRNSGYHQGGIFRVYLKKISWERSTQARYGPFCPRMVSRRGCETIKASLSRLYPHKRDHVLVERVPLEPLFRILPQHPYQRILPSSVFQTTRRRHVTLLTAMYRKIRLGFLTVILLLYLMLDSGTEAQLNFSTGWGKRSQRRGSLDPGSIDCASRVAPTMEQLLNIYHSIQTEVQKMLDCRKLNE